MQMPMGPKINVAEVCDIRVYLWYKNAVIVFCDFFFKTNISVFKAGNLELFAALCFTAPRFFLATTCDMPHSPSIPKVDFVSFFACLHK